jgi:arylsulfate sulfotransferase
MKKINNSGWWLAIAALAALCAPAYATVTIASLKATLKSPQPIGATIGWTATATDTNSGPLTFQFNVAPPGGTMATVKQFNVGTLSGGTWKSQAFSWALTGLDGAYQVQVVVKDFTSGESVSKTTSYVVTSPLTGANPVVQKTQNPLVALFTAPSCAAGSTMRVSFQPQSGSVPATTTNWMNCQPPSPMTFEIAGMYPSTAYDMFAQVSTGGNIVNGSAASFTTGVLPSDVPFPTFQVAIPDSPNDPNQVILHGLFTGTGSTYPDVATDSSGKIVWYNYPNDLAHTTMMVRSFPNSFLADQSGPSWAPGVQAYQVLRQVDWAGNIIRETNIGILEQQLLALGDSDAQPCNAISSPPPVGAACIGIFNHDAIQTLPNGYTAAIVDVEKIFPPGTQGDTSGLPVDIIGCIVAVLDENWNVVWYWDAFDPLNGGNGYPQMPVSRTAVLDEECSGPHSGCLSLFLLGPGVAPEVHDWLHCNSLYYWPAPQDGNTTGGDLIVSSRHQDWVLKVDYRDGAGAGDILWRMGPSGDFTFVNTYNDPWPWFSHQHEAGIEDGGTGVLSLMDNGNTRVSPPGESTGGVPGLGANCGPNDCNSRGMALTFDETTMLVNPVLSANLGVYSSAMGSAQLLADGNYYFLAAIVVVDHVQSGYDIQIQPTPGTDTGPQVMNIAGPPSYRSWQMPNLYSPPIT